MNAVTDLLANLVSIPSVNPMGRAVSGPQYYETALTAFLVDWLQPLGLEVRRHLVSPGRDNLLATWHAPRARRHLLLEVHQDTVPVDGMVIEPFRPKNEGGRLYGRGACDNKGPMTAMLLTLRRLAVEQPVTAVTVTLALTVDEEYGMSGARQLVCGGLAVDAAVVAEPTELDLVIAHKGVVRWEIITTGAACHSSDPSRGVNAVYRMALVLAALERYSQALGHRPAADPLLGGPTLSVGRIEGGSAVNIVPDFCRIEVDRRLIPGETPSTVRHEIAEFLGRDAAITFPIEHRPPWLEAPPMSAERNGQLSAGFGRAIDAVRRTHAKRAVPFGTDAAVFHAAGIPSVVFGPGSVAQAHTVDEWVPLDEVALAAEIYYHFCVHFEELCGS